MAVSAVNPDKYTRSLVPIQLPPVGKSAYSGTRCAPVDKIGILAIRERSFWLQLFQSEISC